MIDRKATQRVAFFMRDTSPSYDIDCSLKT